MGEIKALLKEARKLVDEKNFKEAQECCKNLLKKDKQNYLALVLLGKSLQDDEQATLAFQKAISLKQDNPLAWYGLSNYYEKNLNHDFKAKLIPIYEEMLKLQLEDDKILDLIAKLSNIGCHLKDSRAIGILVNFITQHNKQSVIIPIVEQELVKLLNSDITIDENDIPNIIGILQSLCQKEDHDSSTDIILVKLMVNSAENINETIEQIMEYSFFSKNKGVREFLCFCLCKVYFKYKSFKILHFNKFINELTNELDNKYSILLKSMIIYDNKSYQEAYEIYSSAVDYNNLENLEIWFIIQCALRLKFYTTAEKLSLIYLQKPVDDDLKLELKKSLFVALVEQQKWDNAMVTIKTVPLESMNYDERALLAECYIENHKPAHDLMKSLAETHHYLPLQVLSLFKNKDFKGIIALLEGNTIEHSRCLFYLGVAYFELKEFTKCHNNLLKAAQSDSTHAYSFLYLGHFYRHVQDFEKARKCYEKAYKLNSNDIIIIQTLSEIYVTLNLKEINFQLLINAHNNKRNNSNISFRLGLHYLNRKDWENAITMFRYVIKENVNNISALECLADAYYSRGSFTSALKAYKKVISLRNNNSHSTIHCLTKIGYIHCLLTQYEEAITTFELALNYESQSILALKGIAETWLKTASKKLESKMFGSARNCAQNAINYIIRVLSLETKFLCMWKMLADVLFFITKLPNKYAFVSLQLPSNEESKEVGGLVADKLAIYPYAISFYSQIVKRKNLSSSYDIASAYISLYCESNEDVHGRMAFNLALICLKDKPSLWRNWNLLGKICLQLKKYSIAHHCFIKALNITRKWGVAKIWCNLGTLYLIITKIKLANYCFWRGQSTLPSYPCSWIGQALIAEEMRPEEAMDLFRHASRLGYHRESALGYADWVCRTLSTKSKDIEYEYVIESLYAVPYALDLMEWFTCYEPDTSHSNTILGILQERCGLFRNAYTSYEKALSQVVESKKNIALVNLGRIYLRLHKYDEAITTFKSITESSMDSTCGLALALFRKGLHEEAYAAYGVALHYLCTNDNEKVDLLVAMAGIAYLFNGPDDAKILLFQSIQLSQERPSPMSLFALCSLGLIHTDSDLTKIALTELTKYDMDSNYSFDIGFLRSYLFIKEGNIENGIKLISEMLLDNPNSANLWFCMALYCLHHLNGNAAGACAQRAMNLAQNQKLLFNPANVLATASVALYVTNCKGQSLILAKEGLHLYPNHEEIWAALIFSLSSKNFTQKKSIITAANHIRNHLQPTKLLSLWINRIEKRI